MVVSPARIAESALNRLVPIRTLPFSSASARKPGALITWAISRGTMPSWQLPHGMTDSSPLAFL